MKRCLFPLLLPLTTVLLPAAPPAPLAAPFDAAAARRGQEAWAAHLGQPVEETNSIGMALRLIPPGRFIQGDSTRVHEVARQDPARYWTPERAAENAKNDGPAHPVTLARPYRISATEVTIAQFAAFIRDSGYIPEAVRDGQGGDSRGFGKGPEFTWEKPYGPQGGEHPDYPVTQVTPADASAFCGWLSRKEGRRYRLPTESEWEWAARSGTETLWFFGDDPALLPDHAVTGSKRHAHTGQKKPNAFGLFDTAGNVWEWTADFNSIYAGIAERTDPQPAKEGTHVVRRGGWAAVEPVETRSAHRKWSPPAYRGAHVGFRVVAEP